jgi:NADPH2:quinone reductase
VVVGFTGGSIPEVRVNRLLLNNVSVVGAGWGAYAMGKPEYLRETGAELDRLIESGDVRPVVGRRLRFAEAAEALRVIDRREALGKVVLEG